MGRLRTYSDEVGASSSLFPSWRLGLAIIGFFGFLNAYSQRVGMSVAIVCMVNHTALKELDQDSPSNTSWGVNSTEVPPVADVDSSCQGVANSSSQLDGPFLWEKEIQGHVLGSFFYGYLVSQIPGGMLAERFGGKKVFAIFMGISTLGTWLTPAAAKIHVYLLIFVRVIAGIGSGALFPCMHAVWGHWAPPLERSMLVSISCAGAFFGNVVAYPVSGLLCQKGFAGGWPSIFYLFGITSTIWLVVWLLLVSDTPSNHRLISAKEKGHILRSLKGQVSHENTKDIVPWLKIVRSMPVWAIIVGNFCTDWGLYTLLTNIPTYMFEVLKFDIASNGLYSALPFLGLYICMTIASVIADKLRSKGLLSTAKTRKLMQISGSVGAALFIIGLGFLTCENAMLAVAMLTLGVTFTGFTYSGWLPNHMDIAPKYAGTLYGITNCVGATSGFIAPYVAAVLTKEQSQGAWLRVFFIAAAIYIFGAVFFGIFAGGEVQDWAREEDESLPEAAKLKQGEDGKEMVAFNSKDHSKEAMA